jgi:hypothetical protein
MDTNRHTWFISAEKYVYDGTEVSLASTIGEFDTTINLWLLGRNSNNNSLKKYAKCKLYSCKMWYSNALVRDFIPCKNNNNEIGLYDLVSQTFFGNDGTGDFIAGNEVGYPNPDHPQDIRVVTGNNTIGVQGYNLVDVSPYQEETKNGVTLSKDSDGNIILNGTSTSAFGWNVSLPETRVLPAGTYTKSITKDSNIGTHLTVSIGYNGSSISGTSIQPFIGTSTMTLASDTTFDQVRMYIANNTTFNNYKLSYMILSGTYTTETLPDWEPYYHADYPINLGSIELCKIGDYQDYLYKENGNWYKHQIIDKVKLDGTWSNTSINTTSTNTTRMYLTNIQEHAAISVKISVNENLQLCDKLICASISGVDKEGCYAGSNRTAVIRLNKERAGTTKETFNQYLSKNNITVYYTVQESFSTQITDTTLISQLNAIDKAKGNNGTTIITTTGDDLAPILNFTAYLKEVE